MVWADVIVTVPTLVWVLPLVIGICWLWYHFTVRLWDRHVTPWMIRRLEAKIAAINETASACPLPKPRETDMPGHYIVHESNDHIYSIPLGTLGQDENMNQWRLTKNGWEPWD